MSACRACRREDGPSSLDLCNYHADTLEKRLANSEKLCGELEIALRLVLGNYYLENRDDNGKQLHFWKTCDQPSCSAARAAIASLAAGRSET
jgi:hypothetical protein